MEVTGPISSLPGSTRSAGKNTVCDTHADRLAIALIQGETDSFGAELYHVCQECLDEHRAEARRMAIGTCQWCRKESDSLAPTRDSDEGSSGPVYYVCLPCRLKKQQEDHEEYEWMQQQERDRYGDPMEYECDPCEDFDEVDQ